MKSYSALDLFAGAGGMSIGLKQAGFDVTGLEIDPAACRTHEASVGPCWCMDVTAFHPQSRIDVVAGGSPCKSFSRAGGRRALDDDRGVLMFQVPRVAMEGGARAILYENVPEVLTTPGYSTRPEPASFFLEQSMADAGFPYVSHTLINSADYGVPQIRRRVFFVAFARADDAAHFAWPAPTHGDEGALPWVTAREAIGVPYDAPAPTVTGTEQKSGTKSALTIPYRQLQHAYERMVSRAGVVFPKPTPEQWGKIMAFPPGFRFLGSSAEQHMQAGNAVCPPVAKALGARLRAAFAASDRGGS